MHRRVAIAVSAALAMACAWPAVAAASESLVAATSEVAAAAPATDPQPPPAPSTDPQPPPDPIADPQPPPAPSTDPQPPPDPIADPQPPPAPSTDPQPPPDPIADPEPDPHPQPDSDDESVADDEPVPHPAAGDEAGERPSGENAGEARPPAPAAAGAATKGTQAFAQGAPAGTIATASVRSAAVVETASDPTTRTSARGTSVVARLVSGHATPLAEKPMALGAEPGQLAPDLLTALRAHTEQRDFRARERANGASARKPTAARGDSSPAPILPLGPPLDIVAGSSAGPGGIAPSPLWCVLCTGHAVRAAHELRRLRALLLAPDLPGLPSLRDRPG